MIAAKKKKAKGTLQIALTGAGSYTVTGKGFRKTAQSSKSFKLAAGAYKVSAPGATVSRGSVKVKAGKKVSVSVAFPAGAAETPPPVQTPPPTDPTTPPPVDTTPPGKVTSITVGTRTLSSVALSWTNPGDSDLAEVIVRRAQGGTAPATPTAGAAVTLGTPKATAVNDDDLTADTTYSYAVFTRDTSNNINPSPTTATTSTTAPPPGAIGAVQRINTDSAGTQADGNSYGETWSPDGTMIAFTSGASNLVSGDTNGVADLFVKTLSTGAIQRISTDATGSQANDRTFVPAPAWSPDGTQVAFASYASNLVPNDTNNTADVFVKTLANGAIQRVSTDATGGEASDRYESPSHSPAWSPDGTKIAFTSYGSNLVPGDTNDSGDVFVKTLSSGAIERVSTDAANGQVNGTSVSADWSPDGTKITFSSDASNLVTGDTNGNYDVFVKTLSTGAVQRISVNVEGPFSSADYGDPVWSPDGTKIAFDYLFTDSFHTGVFVATLATGTIQRVSSDANGNPGFGSRNPAWSPDGTQVAFDSDSYLPPLVPGDTNDRPDVFVKTLATGAIQRVSTDALGRQANDSSVSPAWSPDGTKLAFGSDASNLVPGDTNDSDDVFVKTLP